MRKKNTFIAVLLIIYIFGFIVISAVFGANVEGLDGTFPVPEPASLFLLGVGLVGLAGFGRKRFKK